MEFSDDSLSFLQKQSLINLYSLIKDASHNECV